ncbi:hypothetical protein [Anabaena sp. PCC 7108]|nr:hypothetical protein [Anabaena sp. PCC 7108]
MTHSNSDSYGALRYRNTANPLEDRLLRRSHFIEESDRSNLTVSQKHS